MALQIPNYSVKSKLAIGGMSTVYLAKKHSKTRTLAVKVFNPDKHSHQFTENFLREAKTLATLKHKNIVPLYDINLLDSGELYMAMEYIPGGDLEDRKKRGLPENNALQVLIELGHVLEYLHKNNIVHCDIKPANILFREDNSVVLIDFGICRNLEHSGQNEKSAVAIGSPEYSSPEQAQGLPLDPRTDIYSLGVVFLEMLTGENPFKGDTQRHSSLNHLHMPIPRLSGRQTRYQELLNKMLAKQPHDRFKNMTECMECLDSILVGGTVIQPDNTVHQNTVPVLNQHYKNSVA